MNRTLNLKIEGNEYEIRRMNVRQQLHLARRISPMLSALPETNNEISLASLKTIFEVLASDDDTNFDYIFDRCLATVSRLQNKVYSPIMNDSVMCYEDIELDTALDLIVRVIRFNLEDMLKKISSRVKGTAG